MDDFQEHPDSPEDNVGDLISISYYREKIAISLVVT